MAKPKDGITRQSINIFVFLRDVLLAGLSRGKLMPITISLILIVAILKMPSEDVSKLIFEIYDNLVDFSILGYILFLIALVCWAAHMRLQRRVNAREVRRLSQERNDWQKKILGDVPIESSKRKKK